MLILSFLLAPAAWGFTASPAARELSFEERIEAQRAIERVYYSHLIDATRSFEKAVPREILESKVRTSLKQSAALDRYWHAPISGEALRHEARRIAGSTRFPERLREIYEALGNDGFVFQECFARPLLAQRLIHSFFADASRFQEPRGREEEGDAATAPPRAPVSYEHWWDATAPGLDEGSVGAAASSLDTLPAIPEGINLETSGCTPDNTWDNGSLDDLPDPREYHTAVWTGTLLIVWGGFNGSHLLNTGSRYDPLTDIWASTSTSGAPTERQNHTAVWTGSVMVIWGGQQSGGGAPATG